MHRDIFTLLAQSNEYAISYRMGQIVGVLILVIIVLAVFKKFSSKKKD